MSQPAVASFGGLRGHQRVREFLRSAVAQQRLPHAMLFTGPDGVGKRSLAGALTAWLQCEQGGDDACGVCASCVRLASGSHSDVFGLTLAAGKKEIGIDRVRDLKRFMQLRPVGGRLKMALIDDAHLLSIAAQNALLKILEEPPAHSFLVLVTANPDALLPTVRSRCQRVRFGPLPDEVVVDILRRSADLDTEAVRRLARLAEGSPGHALTLVDCLDGAQPEAWQRHLAAVGQARYVQLAETARELNSPESHVLVKLEMILSQLRDEAVQSVRSVSAPLDRAALRRADAVDAACNLLRRGNPNRQLLLEALLLRLAVA